MMLKPEDGRYLEQVFAGGELDVAKTRKAVFDFFGGIGTVVDYLSLIHIYPAGSVESGQRPHQQRAVPLLSLIHI